MTAASTVSPVLLLVLPLVGLAAQPGNPPNNPDSWVTAGTAKIFCSAIFVSGRDSAEERAHLTDYFIHDKKDSITRIEIDRRRKIVRVTLANRITREAQVYGD